MIILNNNNIQKAFNNIGAKAPSIKDIISSNGWTLCQAINPKHKGKINYICNNQYYGNKLLLKISIHSHLDGGYASSFIFTSNLSDSDYYLNENSVQQDKVPLKSLNDEQALELKNLKKREKFLSTVELYSNGSINISEHPYTKKKKLKNS